jgi:hypothetical protein
MSETEADAALVVLNSMSGPSVDARQDNPDVYAVIDELEKALA